MPYGIDEALYLARFAPPTEKRETSMTEAAIQPADLPREQPAPGAGPARRPYTPPTLERLGEWSALTLQQSIGVGPGNW